MEALQGGANAIYSFVGNTINALFFTARTMTWSHAFILSIILSFLLFFFIVVSLSFPRQLRLKGLHVVITGGSSGIGLACAKECARRGARVTLIARNLVKLNQARVDVEKEYSEGRQHPGENRFCSLFCFH